MSADSSAAALVGADASAGSSNSKRFRHFWEGPKPAAEQGAEEETTQSSPVARLYQHALESVFGFLTLADLSRALAVSHCWSVAVLRMPCARFRTACRSESVVVLSSSALSAHVTTIANSVEDVQCELSSDQLYILACRMPQLTALECSITQAAANKVILPPNLQTLKLTLGYIDAAAVNKILSGISQLPALITLDLTVPSFLPALSFASLTAMRTLEELSLGSADIASQPSEAQLDQLRALPHLRKMAVVAISNVLLAYLLRTPHDLRWQQLQWAKGLDAVASAALSSLPSLTRLNTNKCVDIGFLPHLVQLRTLELHINMAPWPATVPAEAVIDGLACCPLITVLDLAAPLNNKQLSVVLPRLPLLTKLTLLCMLELESLAFLSSGPIVHRLRSLDLLGCCNAALRSSELQHAYALTALEELCIMESFAGEPFSSLDLWLHTPPSKLMPQLKSFRYRQLDDEDMDEDDEDEDE